MSWRLAKSLEQLRSQVDAAFPGRDKSSDGTIGDERHAATKSEHNPDANGVVRAMDISHDPAHGLDARALAEALVASRDPRILYVISNAEINSSVKAPWTWRPYTGVNAHRHHVHISVVEDPARYDDANPWLGLVAKQPSPPVSPAPGLASAARRLTRITATEFAGPGDPETSAYTGKPIDPDVAGVALPFRFKGALPMVRVIDPRTGRSVVCQIVDVGPWNSVPGDPYWLQDNGRPIVELQRLRGIPAQNGRIPTNDAALDMTPAAWAALGLAGRGKDVLDWEFVTPPPQPKGPPPVAIPNTAPVPAAATVLSSIPFDQIEAGIDKILMIAPFAINFLPANIRPAVTEALEHLPGVELSLQLAHIALTLDGPAVRVAQAAAARAWADKQSAPPALPVDLQGRTQ